MNLQLELQLLITILTLCEFLLCMDVVSNVAQLFLHHSANKVINPIKKLKKGHDESKTVFRIRDILVRIQISYYFAC